MLSRLISGLALTWLIMSDYYDYVYALELAQSQEAHVVSVSEIFKKV